MTFVAALDSRDRAHAGAWAEDAVLADQPAGDDAVSCAPPETVLLTTVTLLTVPPFDPARMPMNWPGPVMFGFAVTLALVMLRLFTWPVAPIVPNMPMLTLAAPGAMGAMVRLLMVMF